MSIALYRVDNRLVHGQVLEAWLPALNARGVLVADDEAAGNALARAAMGLAIPPGVKFEVLRVEAAAKLLAEGGLRADRTLVLVRDVRDAARLRALGVPLEALNIGNVHFAAGRRQVTPSVFLDDDEVKALRALEASGTRVELRAVPGERARTLDEIAPAP